MLNIASSTGKCLEEAILSEDSTLLFVGSKKTVNTVCYNGRRQGKTTAIYRFLNRDEPPKPTFALEYTFGRQTRSTTLSKDVCNIWELGGGTLFPALLQVPISEKVLMNLTVVIMVDLSAPDELLSTLTTLLEALKQTFDAVLEKQDMAIKNMRDTLLAAAWRRLGEDHPDQAAIQPFLVPLVIVGGKYDIFQNFEPWQRKLICQTLRYFAHTNGATLQFFSMQMENLVNHCRVLLSHLIFETPLPNYISQDYNKPLIVPAGTDSFQRIGTLIGMENTNLSTASWSNAYNAHFSQPFRRSELPGDPARDANFREPLIDNLRAQKDEEFERYKREMSFHQCDFSLDISP